MKYLSLLMVMRALPFWPGMRTTSLTSSAPPSSLLTNSGKAWLDGAAVGVVAADREPKRAEIGLDDDGDLTAELVDVVAAEAAGWT